MRGDPVPRPRRIGRHVSAALDMLDAAGARDVRVWKTRHVVIAFAIVGREHEIHMACTPKSEHDAAVHFRQALGRVMRGAA